MEPMEMRHEMMHMEDYDIVNDTIDSMMDIYDELDGAKAYVKEAMKLKQVDKSIADNRLSMSAQELGHADNLTAAVNKMMERMKSDKHPCYDVLAKVWTHIHTRQDGYKAWIKTMHEQYNKA